MKKNYFWSPHIDPQVATLKSVFNSLNSLAKYENNFKNVLINVFGEWDEYKFHSIDKINLIVSRRLLKKKFKGFFNSRFLYLQIFINSYFPLKKIINRDKPDHLIIHLITSIPILMFILNDFKTKLILRISGFPKMNFFRFILWKLVSKKIKYVICPTEETKNFFIKKKIFDPKKIIFIPDPIIEIKKINILKRQIIDDEIEKPFFLSVGRFTKQKNHIFLLNFFAKNLHYLNDFQFIIIGDGELKRDYLKLISKKQLEDKIKILPYKKNVLNYIYNAKCIISSSLWEDPGFIMIEAAAAGTPIITSNCPNGPKEFIGKDETGFIFDTNNNDSFRKVLDNFIGSSNDSIYNKLIAAKKRAKIYTCLHNSTKLSNILKN